jgi:hypothetical protein
MEFVLTSQDLEPLPKPSYISTEGLLNSNYKCIVNDTLKNSNPHTIFGIKQRIKSRQYQKTIGIETILKLSVFTVAILLIFY